MFYWNIKYIVIVMLKFVCIKYWIKECKLKSFLLELKVKMFIWLIDIIIVLCKFEINKNLNYV